MKEALVIGVLALAVLATPYPYHPYKLNGDLKNIQSNQDLNRRPEAYQLEPAPIREYTAQLRMQGKKPGKVISNDTEQDSTKKTVVQCVERGTSISLQKAQLEMILDTVYPATGNPIPFTNIITPDHGTSVYFHELTPLFAYQQMLERSTETDNIWANYSPCPSCARALLNHYNKPEDDKPTIHVARIYSESNSLTHVVDSFQCLAKLIHEGFDIIPWNFNEFKAPAGVPAFIDTCISLIDVYYGYGNFTSAYMELENHVRFVQELGQNPNSNSWCAP